MSTPQIQCGSSKNEANLDFFSQNSNTTVLARRYAFDAELFQAGISGTLPLTGDLIATASIPFRSRSAGVMDGAIRSWHDAFDLPDGSTDRVDKDAYRVRGRRDDGELFALPKHQFTLANVMAGIAGSIHSLDSSAWILSASLPTAIEGSGHRGVNTHLDFRNLNSFNQWALTTGIGGTYVGLREFDGVQFNPLLWRISETVRYQLIPGTFYIEVAFQYERTAVDNLPAYPNEALSVDTRIILNTFEKNSIVASLREDIGGANAQADLIIGLNWLSSF